MRVALFVAGCSLLAACVGVIETGTDGIPDDEAGGEGDASSGGSDFDRAMMEIAQSYAAFSQINERPYQSAVGAFEINLYVQGDAREYRRIHPEAVSAVDPIDPIHVGTVIVREVLDAQGAIAKLTLMAKGPRGYDPALGDWWFGEADPQGRPLVVDGAVRLGRLTDCHGCHLPRAGADYLFGVPEAAQ